ncbi:MAG TPA: glucosyl-3-phosphoglycerate synthase [Solirubrobacteraceae bacterium]|nr:glucosyl-3-phosphoglycerate synthase [Solirubrobacteraceae bacterium]
MPARTFHHSAFSAERIARERSRRDLRISVCLPARECARTVGEIVRALLELREADAIDRVVVVDAASPDGTAEVAEAAGAEVWQEAELLPSFGAVRGKGDAMWRALSRLDDQLVCFVDADTEGFSAHFVTGLLGPLVCEEGCSFVKGFYRRPFSGAADADARAGEGGGRVNHLTARPALALLYPELAEIRQPLAGEIAARRELLVRLPFATGYGVETAMLIDAWREVGSDGIAQVDLDEHRNHHQSLTQLAPMALTVLATALDRARADGRLALSAPADLSAHVPLERPPLATLAGGLSVVDPQPRVGGART